MKFKDEIKYHIQQAYSSAFRWMRISEKDTNKNHNTHLCDWLLAEGGKYIENYEDFCQLAEFLKEKGFQINLPPNREEFTGNYELYKKRHGAGEQSKSVNKIYRAERREKIAPYSRSTVPPSHYLVDFLSEPTKFKEKLNEMLNSLALTKDAIAKLKEQGASEQLNERGFFSARLAEQTTVLSSLPWYQEMKNRAAEQKFSAKFTALSLSATQSSNLEDELKKEKFSSDYMKLG